MKVSIIGCGRVGLVVAACLAKMGNKIVVVDIDEERIEAVNNGSSPIYEEGLDEILSQVEVEATSDYSKIENSDMILICVNTPSDGDGSIALEQVTQAAKQVTTVLRRQKHYQVIAVKSTVVPGTTQEVILPILESSGKRVGHEFGICVVPEFLREGKGVYDFTNPARVIVGEYDRKSGDMLCNLYQGLDVPILRVDLRTAEMIKYASNAFLATKISFINEIGNICKQLGINTYEVARGMGLDERIGGKFLDAGIGFGGPCLPKDLKALIAMTRELGYEPKLLEQVLELNDKQALRVIGLLKKHVSLRHSSIGILGLSYRPDTDDVRDSKAITVVNILLKEGAKVKVYDPQAMQNFSISFPQVHCTTAQEVLKCDAVVIMTKWEEFEQLDYRGKVVIDGRRVLKAREARIYEGVCW